MLEYGYDPPPYDGSDKVYFLDTDHIWGHGGHALWAWRATLRGYLPLFMDPWEPAPGTLIPGLARGRGPGHSGVDSRYYYLWDPLRRALGDCRRLMERLVDLSRAVPSTEISTSRYALANPGVEYVILFPYGDAEGIRLPEGQDYEATWIAVESGIETPADSLRQQHMAWSLAPPDGKPSVLWLRRIDA